MPNFIPIDTKEVDWNNSSKILCMKDATRMSLYVCHHRPPLNCRQRTLGRLPEVWGRWNRGVNLNLGPITLLSDFPTRSGIYWAPIVYLFVCLRLCRLPFHWVHLFLSCSHVTGSLLNSLSISFWGARAHNHYFVHTYTCTHIHIHTSTYILLFCLPKMTNRRCARTSLPPMRNKDVLGPASPHWVIEQHRIASTCLYELFE